MFTFPNDLKTQRLQGFNDPIARRIDREFHTTVILPSATYAASTSLSSSKTSLPQCLGHGDSLRPDEAVGASRNHVTHPKKLC